MCGKGGAAAHKSAPKNAGAVRQKYRVDHSGSATLALVITAASKSVIFDGNVAERLVSRRFVGAPRLKSAPHPGS